MGIEITVLGTPGPQGSKRLVRGRMIEASAKVKPWREDVRAAVTRAMDLRVCSDATSFIATQRMGVEGYPFPMAGPLRVCLVFTLRKPDSAPKRTRTWPAKKPDIDKLVRSTFDAITSAGLWKDDAQVVELVTVKTFPNEHPQALPVPGCRITVEAIA